MTEEFHARKEEQVSRQGAKTPRYKFNIFTLAFLGVLAPWRESPSYVSQKYR
jgi:hypothetical protein